MAEKINIFFHRVFFSISMGWFASLIFHASVPKVAAWVFFGSWALKFIMDKVFPESGYSGYYRERMKQNPRLH